MGVERSDTVFKVKDGDQLMTRMHDQKGLHKDPGAQASNSAEARIAGLMRLN